MTLLTASLQDWRDVPGEGDRLARLAGAGLDGMAATPRTARERIPRHFIAVISYCSRVIAGRSIVT